MPINISDFDYIRKLVYDRTGVSLSEEKMYLVESRLGMVAKAAGANSVSGLVAELKQIKQKRFNPLYESIVEAMMTNETFFFRDINPFEILKTSVVPELLKKQQGDRTLNIYLVCCLFQWPRTLQYCDAAARIFSAVGEKSSADTW